MLPMDRLHRPKEPCNRWAYLWAPPGEYDWTDWRCGCRYRYCINLFWPAVTNYPVSCHPYIAIIAISAIGMVDKRWGAQLVTRTWIRGYDVVRGDRFLGGVGYTEGVMLFPPKIFYEYYPWKWCILVHFSTNLDFRVEGLNPEVGEGVNNWVWWVQPLVPPIHCILLLCVADVLWWDMISIVIGKSHRRGHIPRCTPPRISWWRWTPTRCVKSSMYP